MSAVLFFLSIFLYFLFLRRYNFLSPGNAFSIVTLLSFLSFYVTVELRWLPDLLLGLSNSWKFQLAGTFSQYSEPVSVLLFFGVAFGVAAEVLSSRLAGQAHLTSAEAYDRMISTLKKLVLRNTVSWPLTLLYALLLVMVAAHLLSGGMSGAFSPHPYRFAKSADWLGLTQPLARVIHGTPDLIEFMCIVLCAVHLSARQYHLAFLTTVVAVYCGTLEFALSSRSQALALVLIAVLSMILIRGWIRWLVGGFATFMAIVAYEVALLGREAGTVSIGAMLNHFSNVSLSGVDLFWRLGVMTFIGGTRAAYSLGRPVEFPIPYQALSALSPFPSSIDGFDAWASYSSPIMGDVWKPLGGFGELVNFSPLVYIPFVILMFACFVIVGVVVRRQPGLPALLLFGMTFLPIVKFADYELRGHTRTMILAALVAVVLTLWERHNRRRQKRRSALGYHSKSETVLDTATT